MKISYDNRYTTKVSTAFLIQDAQTLMQALRLLADGDINEARNCIRTVIRRLDDTIQATSVPEGGFRPSAQSMVCQSMDEGLVLIDGKEPVCASGFAFSKCRDCDPELCMHSWIYGEGANCEPRAGVILHESGQLYIGVASEDEKLFKE